MLYFFLCTCPFNAAAQADSTAMKPKHRFLKNYAIPISMIGMGVYGTTDNYLINHDEIKEERNEYFSGFSHRADNYLQFAPVAAVGLFSAFGLKGKHSPAQQALLFGKAELIMMVMVMPIKNWAHVQRPDSSAFNSFPSGHTAQAFMAADFFRREFGSRYPWVSVGMYSLATGIGVFRILNNRHWVSDVIAGAGFGMLSATLSYSLHKSLHNRLLPQALIPQSKNGAMALTAIYRL